MSKEYADSIRDILDNGDEIPQRVTNRMIFAAQRELYQLASSARAEAQEAQKQASKNTETLKDVRAEIKPIKQIVYGAVGLILTAFVLGLIAMVFTS
jgi:hypothetical protein